METKNYYDESGKLRNGECKSYYSDGNFDIGFYKDGKREGEWKEYHDNGKLFQVGSYKNGLKEGEFRSYHSSGELFIVSFWKSGEEDGEYVFYFYDGDLESITHYKNGKKQEEVLFNENKKIQSVINYADGLEESKFEFEYKYRKLINVKNER
tara:strand:- start:1734 stop:2192 length:459 start_codon:yes stop_codon:yes gene_type:complete